MKKKRKVLVGWTMVGWQKRFTKSHPNWKDRVFITGIMNRKTPYLADVKVRVTIEEVL
jgi:hypothetical protein